VIDPADTHARVRDCLLLVEPRRKRGDVHFWGVLGVLPCFLLGARFGLGLSPVPALGAALAGWMPVLLLWWNRHAEREQARLAQAAARFEDAFPVKGVGRPQALEVLAGIAAERGHEHLHAAHLLLAEIESAGDAPAARTPTPRAFVAPDIEYRGPGAFTSDALKPVPAGEPLLPPELQGEIGGAPQLDPIAPAVQPATKGAAGKTASPRSAPGDAPARPEPGPGSDEPDAFDYIPLEPHEPKR